MEEIELIYGTGCKTEKDVVEECIRRIRLIENVIDIKGIEFIHTYLSDKLNELK